MKMKKALVIAAAMLPAMMFGQINELERATPESQGVPSKSIISFLDSITSLSTAEIHSAIIMRHGKVIAETYPKPFRPEYGQTLFSCSKTFTSAAIGMAINENRLRLTDRLAAFYPELLPDPIPKELADIDLRDLLTMQSGFKVTDDVRTYQTKWIKGCINNSMVSKPGTRFAYDSMDTYLISAILTKVTRTTLFDYLKPRLFEPLHITKVNWEWSPEGISCGGWGLYLQPESMAKFGQLLLDKGQWKGKQLIPASWVEEMMKTQVKSSKYGYQMWVCSNPGTAKADGAFGQYIIVMPKEDMVAVITQSMTGDAGKREQEMLYRIVLPGIKETYIPDERGYKVLARKQDSYALPYATGKASSTNQKAISASTYKISKNRLGWKTISISTVGKDLVVSINTDKYGTVKLNCGHKEWSTSSVPVAFPPYSRSATQGAFSGFSKPFTAASSYGWKDTNVLETKTHFVDWMSGFTLTFYFESKTPTLYVKYNYEKAKYSFALKAEPKQ